MAKQRIRTNSNVPAKGRLREMCDQLWSLAVRADWRNVCAVCGSTKVEAHHLVPRQFEATRYELLNGIALCCTCHKFDAKISPHLNAACWCAWLNDVHPTRFEWYLLNRRPQFSGTKNAAYYCEMLRKLKQYVEPEDFTRIVGVKFSAWLEETQENAEESSVDE